MEEGPVGLATGSVSFGGVTKEVCLACVPDVEVGDYVVVHAGFAISKVDEREAEETLRMLRELSGSPAPDEAG
jgi:hydrogenase expression/formation protein HypC